MDHSSFYSEKQQKKKPSVQHHKCLCFWVKQTSLSRFFLSGAWFTFWRRTRFVIPKFARWFRSVSWICVVMKFVTAAYEKTTVSTLTVSSSWRSGWCSTSNVRTIYNNIRKLINNVRKLYNNPRKLYNIYLCVCLRYFSWRNRSGGKDVLERDRVTAGSSGETALLFKEKKNTR